MEELSERARLSQAQKAEEEDLRKLCESFVKGQGSIYVLEKGNKVKTANGMQKNGPNYVEHAWNQREVGKSAVANFVNTNEGSHHIYPKFQEYAIVIAVSESLLEGSVLAKYQSHEFPSISFKATGNGEIYIVNGHHRIAAWKSIHQELLNQLHSYERLLTGGLEVASDHDTPEIIEAREKVDALKDELVMQGGWGAIVLDYGRFQSNIHQFDE